MSTSSILFQTTINGSSYSMTRTTEEYDLVTVIPTVSFPGGKTGTLTTRTDANTGTLTMDSGHGIGTGQRLDIYWTTNGLQYCQRGATVGTVSVNSVPIDGGVGSDLPANNTAIVAMVPTLQTVTLDTGDFVMWCARTSTTKAVTLSFGTTSGSYTEDAVVTLNGSDNEYGDTIVWASTYFAANPIVGASNFNSVYISHGDTSSATVSVSIGTT